jgi:two-component system, chemotaxis family, response regulator Rcp1
MLQLSQHTSFTEVLPTFKILLAEDNPGDVRLFCEALDSRALPFDLTVAKDGEKAIAIVNEVLAGRERLDLIVLDVNLPRQKGDEVLRHVRAAPSLRSIPVIVLTSSSAPADQEAATWLGADHYIRKPSDLDELMQVAKVIEEVLRPTT